jgi:hypothetical protein
MITIIVIENNNPREISIKLQSREERNSVLDKLRALVTANNLTVNPMRRGSAVSTARRPSLHSSVPEKDPRKVDSEKDKFAARASRRLSKRELVIEENLTGGVSSSNFSNSDDSVKVCTSEFI